MDYCFEPPGQATHLHGGVMRLSGQPTSVGLAVGGCRTAFRRTGGANLDGFGSPDVPAGF